MSRKWFPKEKPETELEPSNRQREASFEAFGMSKQPLYAKELFETLLTKEEFKVLNIIWENRDNTENILDKLLEGEEKNV